MKPLQRCFAIFVVAGLALSVGCDQQETAVGPLSNWGPRATLAPPPTSQSVLDVASPLPTYFILKKPPAAPEYPPPLNDRPVFKVQVYDSTHTPSWIALDTTFANGVGGFLWSAQCTVNGGSTHYPCIVIRADGWLNPVQQIVDPSAIVLDNQGGDTYQIPAGGPYPDTSFTITINGGYHVVFETYYTTFIEAVLGGSFQPLKWRLYDVYPSVIDSTMLSGDFVLDNSGSFRFASCKTTPKTRCNYP